MREKTTSVYNVKENLFNWLAADDFLKGTQNALTIRKIIDKLYYIKSVWIT